MPKTPAESAPHAVAELSAQLAADPNLLLRAYAAGTPFRPATAEELITPANPFRRPVRPADLSFLDFAPVLPEENHRRLSGLLGHRMLRNVHDAEHGLLAPGPDGAASADGAYFHSPGNRLLGQLVRPALEHHLFGCLETDREPLTAPTLGAVRDEVWAYREELLASPLRAPATAASRKDARSAGVFVLLQMGAVLPAAYTAIGRGAVAETTLAHPDLRPYLLSAWRRWVESASLYQAPYSALELSPAPTAHWQFLLGTSLARGNHLLSLAHDAACLPRLLGAVTQFLIEQSVTAGQLADALHEALGQPAAYFDDLAAAPAPAPAELVDQLLGPLVSCLGEDAVTTFHEGFTDAARLTARWDADLTEQLLWADRIEDFKTYAERIQKHLVDHDIEVDLDTFVESHEETSTTHVHDEHRLVMIESGHMHFWNNVTHRIALSEGDKILIPMSRLHGSVVLSGTCVYHQPIIPDGMFRALTR